MRLFSIATRSHISTFALLKLHTYSHILIGMPPLFQGFPARSLYLMEFYVEIGVDVSYTRSIFSRIIVCGKPENNP
jgi:hypothetical protein